MARMLDKYKKEIVPTLKSEAGDNVMAVPKLTKIVLSMGLGKAVAESSSKARENKRFVEALEHLTTIAGQKPVMTKARKAVSNFKLREGYDVGAMVTLRGTRMYEFLDRLITLAIPRVRDFRGLNPASFDGRGNYNLGLQECGVFPEINPDKINFQQGLNITMCTNSGSDALARKLLTMLGMPFRN
jgi:large subunit ribosomal protein L5